MLPSRAVAKPLSFEDSYDLIKPVYLKALVLIVALPLLTALVFEELLVADSMLMNLFSNLVYQLVWVFEVTVLSHTYDVLIRQAAENDPQQPVTEVI